MAKLRLETADPVSQTLLIPLWARAVEQREPQPLVIDPIAAAVVEQVNYDWSQIRLSRGDLAQCVVRLREFDRFVRDFLQRHPAAAVVHLGCGLDARFQRVDNGQVRWFDLDLPDVIAVRRRLLPESDRDRYLGTFGLRARMDGPTGAAWHRTGSVRRGGVAPVLRGHPGEGADPCPPSPIPGAELVCDVCTPLAVWIDNLHLRFTHSAARMRWAVRDPRDLEAWGRGITLVESFYYFDDPEPRMGLPTWFGRLPVLAHSTSIQRYQLGTAPVSASKDRGGNGSSAGDGGMTA